MKGKVTSWHANHGEKRIVGTTGTFNASYSLLYVATFYLETNFTKSVLGFLIKFKRINKLLGYTVYSAV